MCLPSTSSDQKWSQYAENVTIAENVTNVVAKINIVRNVTSNKNQRNTMLLLYASEVCIMG